MVTSFILTKNWNIENIRNVYDNIQLVDVYFKNNTKDLNCILYKQKSLELKSNKTENDIIEIKPSLYTFTLSVRYEGKEIINRPYKTVWQLQSALNLYYNQFNHNCEFILDEISNELI